MLPIAVLVVLIGFLARSWLLSFVPTVNAMERFTPPDEKQCRGAIGPTAGLPKTVQRAFDPADDWNFVFGQALLLVVLPLLGRSPAAAAESNVITYPFPAGLPDSNRFYVTANGLPVFTHAAEVADFAMFAKTRQGHSVVLNRSR